jgi:hypothetical protein
MQRSRFPPRSFAEKPFPPGRTLPRLAAFRGRKDSQSKTRNRQELRSESTGIEYTRSNGIKAAPKYFVRADAAINVPETKRSRFLRGSSPSIQKYAAHIHRASIIVSHITLLAETSMPGVKRVQSAASKGERVNLRARKYVPKTNAIATRRKPRCSAHSDHPRQRPTKAM